MKNQQIVTAFKKASRSAGGAQDCVEIAHTANGGRAIRDSKNPDGGIQYCTPDEWAAFLDGVKAGRFGV
ncbi:DUF397 domain-containing protein [Streptomyces sp. NPDC050509]|uniref:DUF397 domain-containing protein n=1 Tax=Streptomyces sp. NPDC050509 TaxID=3365620 RepID=UPI0037ACA58D